MSTVVMTIQGLFVALTVFGIFLIERQRKPVREFVRKDLLPRLEENGWTVDQASWKAPGSTTMVVEATWTNGTTATMEVRGL